MSDWNIGPQKVYNTRLWARNMEDEERAQCDAYFEEELESLKTSVAHLTSLHEQTLRNTSGEGPSNWPITFDPAPTAVQPEERMSEHGQEPQQNPTFM